VKAEGSLNTSRPSANDTHLVHSGDIATKFAVIGQQLRQHYEYFEMFTVTLQGLYSTENKFESQPDYRIPWTLADPRIDQHCRWWRGGQHSRLLETKAASSSEVWQLYTRLHGVTAQKTAIFRLTIMRMSNIVHRILAYLNFDNQTEDYDFTAKIW
jgi:hypothetical protein